MAGSPLRQECERGEKTLDKKRLRPEFGWYQWRAAEDDLESLEPRLLNRMLFDTLVINEFEHALIGLQKDDCVWGPVHTSVGQEATAAATTAALRREDKYFATHRAHHQFLAKVLRCELPDSWDPSGGSLPESGKEVLRRTMAEIMALSPAYCGGRGGSMHLRHPEAGFLGSNAIVGGGIPLATGAAFTEKYQNTGNVVVCFFGDRAANQGSFHEACNLAGLWKLLVVFLIENNEYAVATGSTDRMSVIPRCAPSCVQSA